MNKETIYTDGSTIWSRRCLVHLTRQDLSHHHHLTRQDLSHHHHLTRQDLSHHHHLGRNQNTLPSGRVFLLASQLDSSPQIWG